MVIRCPNCGTEYHINDNLVGRWAECASCSKKFVVGQTYSRPIQGGGIKILHRVLVWLFDVWMRAKPLLTNHKRTAVCIGSLSVLGILSLCLSSSRDVEFYDHVIDIGDAPVRRYSSNDRTVFDCMIRATKDGAFGFRWGERPLSKMYKPPCEVEYSIENVLFSKMKLTYDKEGELFGISLSADMFCLELPEGLSKRMQKAICQQLTEQSMPLFFHMLQLAEYLTDQDIHWGRMGDKICGISENDGDNYFVGLRMDLPPKENPQRVLFVMRSK